MDQLLATLEVVYSMDVGQTVEFVSGATLTRNKRNAYRVTDKNGKTYSSLDKDMASMIANKGE